MYNSGVVNFTVPLSLGNMLLKMTLIRKRKR